MWENQRFRQGWIEKFIINEECSIQKGHVLKKLSGPHEDGSVLKVISDGSLSIHAVFTRESIENEFAKSDSQEEWEDDSEPDWDRCAILLKKYRLHHTLHEDVFGCSFHLIVDHFSFYGHEHGLRFKIDPEECMYIDKVRKKSQRLWQEWKQQNLKGNDTAADSVPLSLLLEEMNKEDTPTDSQRCTGSQSMAQENSTEAPLDESELEARRPVLSHNFNSVDNFFISSEEHKILDNLPGWTSDNDLPCLNLRIETLSSNTPPSDTTKRKQVIHRSNSGDSSSREPTGDKPSRKSSSEENTKQSAYAQVGDSLLQNTQTDLQTSENSRKSHVQLTKECANQVGDSLLLNGLTQSQECAEKVQESSNVPLSQDADAQYSQSQQRSAHRSGTNDASNTTSQDSLADSHAPADNQCSCTTSVPTAAATTAAAAAANPVSGDETGCFRVPDSDYIRDSALAFTQETPTKSGLVHSTQQPDQSEFSAPDFPLSPVPEASQLDDVIDDESRGVQIRTVPETLLATSNKTGQDNSNNGDNTASFKILSSQNQEPTTSFYQTAHESALSNPPPNTNDQNSENTAKSQPGSDDSNMFIQDSSDSCEIEQSQSEPEEVMVSYEVDKTSREGNGIQQNTGNSPDKITQEKTEKSVILISSGEKHDNSSEEKAPKSSESTVLISSGDASKTSSDQNALTGLAQKPFSSESPEKTESHEIKHSSEAHDVVKIENFLKETNNKAVTALNDIASEPDGSSQEIPLKTYNEPSEIETQPREMCTHNTHTSEPGVSDPKSETKPRSDENALSDLAQKSISSESVSKKESDNSVKNNDSDTSGVPLSSETSPSRITQGVTRSKISASDSSLFNSPERANEKISKIEVQGIEFDEEAPKAKPDAPNQVLETDTNLNAADSLMVPPLSPVKTSDCPITPARGRADVISASTPKSSLRPRVLQEEYINENPDSPQCATSVHNSSPNQPDRTDDANLRTSFSDDVFAHPKQVDTSSETKSDSTKDTSSSVKEKNRTKPEQTTNKSTDPKALLQKMSQLYKTLDMDEQMKQCVPRRRSLDSRSIDSRSLENLNSSSDSICSFEKANISGGHENLNKSELKDKFITHTSPKTPIPSSTQNVKILMQRSILSPAVQGALEEDLFNNSITPVKRVIKKKKKFGEEESDSDWSFSEEKGQTKKPQFNVVKRAVSRKSSFAANKSVQENIRDMLGAEAKPKYDSSVLFGGLTSKLPTKSRPSTFPPSQQRRKKLYTDKGNVLLELPDETQASETTANLAVVEEEPEYEGTSDEMVDSVVDAFIKTTSIKVIQRPRKPNKKEPVKKGLVDIEENELPVIEEIESPAIMKGKGKDQVKSKAYKSASTDEKDSSTEHSSRPLRSLRSRAQTNYVEPSSITETDESLNTSMDTSVESPRKPAETHTKQIQRDILEEDSDSSEEFDKYTATTSVSKRSNSSKLVSKNVPSKEAAKNSKTPTKAKPANTAKTRRKPSLCMVEDDMHTKEHAKLSKNDAHSDYSGSDDDEIVFDFNASRNRSQNISFTIDDGEPQVFEHVIKMRRVSITRSPEAVTTEHKQLETPVIVIDSSGGSKSGQSSPDGINISVKKRVMTSSKTSLQPCRELTTTKLATKEQKKEQVTETRRKSVKRDVASIKSDPNHQNRNSKDKSSTASKSRDLNTSKSRLQVPNDSVDLSKTSPKIGTGLKRKSLTPESFYVRKARRITHVSPHQQGDESSTAIHSGSTTYGENSRANDVSPRTSSVGKRKRFSVETPSNSLPSHQPLPRPSLRKSPRKPGDISGSLSNTQTRLDMSGASLMTNVNTKSQQDLMQKIKAQIPWCSEPQPLFHIPFNEESQTGLRQDYCAESVKK